MSPVLPARWVVDGQPTVQHARRDCRALMNWRTDSVHEATAVERVIYPMCQVCDDTKIKPAPPVCSVCWLTPCGCDQ